MANRGSFGRRDGREEHLLLLLLLGGRQPVTELSLFKFKLLLSHYFILFSRLGIRRRLVASLARQLSALPSFARGSGVPLAPPPPNARF